MIQTCANNMADRSIAPTPNAFLNDVRVVCKLNVKKNVRRKLISLMIEYFKGTNNSL